MGVLIDLPEIEGYEYTGEYRCPKEGEYYLDGSGVSCHYGRRGDTYGVRFHILRKKRWRAVDGQLYWVVCTEGVLGGWMVDSWYENFDEADTCFYASGNYFQTKEEAEAMAEKVRELFKNG